MVSLGFKLSISWVQSVINASCYHNLGNNGHEADNSFFSFFLHCLLFFHRSVSSVSFMDEPGHESHYQAPVRFENTYQLEPSKKFPYSTVQNIIKESMENLLSEEQYRPEFCRDMTKTLSDVSLKFFCS